MEQERGEQECLLPGRVISRLHESQHGAGAGSGMGGGVPVWWVPGCPQGLGLAVNIVGT